MRHMLSALSLIVLGTSGASSQNRPDVRQMTCGVAQDIVRKSGAIVLTTGPHTFDRYVVHRGYCSPGEMTVAAFEQTVNGSACFIGSRCVPYSPTELD